MTQRVEAPAGCHGLDFPDGSKAHGSGDGLVRVSDRQAAYLRAIRTDLKVLGTTIAGFDGGPWVDCEVCGRSFLRVISSPDEKRCPRHRDA